MLTLCLILWKEQFLKGAGSGGRTEGRCHEARGSCKPPAGLMSGVERASRYLLITCWRSRRTSSQTFLLLVWLCEGDIPEPFLLLHCSHHFILNNYFGHSTVCTWERICWCCDHVNGGLFNGWLIGSLLGIGRAEQMVVAAEAKQSVWLEASPRPVLAASDGPHVGVPHRRCGVLGRPPSSQLCLYAPGGNQAAPSQPNKRGGWTWSLGASSGLGRGPIQEWCLWVR